MPRPRCCRRVGDQPPANLFKPAGVPRVLLTEVVMTLDELEALRLADLEGLYQEPAAERMGVSRSTFARTVEAARHKVAAALVGGHALRIEGGPVHVVGLPSGGGGRHRRGRGVAGGGCPRCGWTGRAAGAGGCQGDSPTTGRVAPCQGSAAST